MFNEENALKLFPGLECKQFQGSRTIKGILNDEFFVDNCDYYYPINLSEDIELTYGCLKCKFGFSGEIEYE